jgi:hypothetical protein
LFIHSHSRSHAVTSDLDITDTAKAAEFFCSDGVIITGRETGMATDLSDVERVRAAVSLPVIVGSGVTDKNVNSYASKVYYRNAGVSLVGLVSSTTNPGPLTQLYRGNHIPSHGQSVHAQVGL